MLKSEFQRFNNFVFDLDGTVWYWDQLVPGASETIEYLQKEGKNIFFVTNNSMLSPEGFVFKLKELGIETDIFHVTCTIELILRYLKDKGAKKVYCLSKPDSRRYLEENGLEISEEPECVIVTYHDEPENNVSKAAELAKSVPLITNATGRFWALKDRKLPGVGVFVERVESLSGRNAEIIGKPSDFSVSYVKEKYGLNPEETIFFGDSLNSDRLFARKSGWTFAFVTTGEYIREDSDKLGQEDKPDFVLGCLKEIME